MRFFWISAAKDLRRFRRDAAALALWFLLPMVVVSLISLVFGRSGGTPHGVLLVADEDHGVAGTVLREWISRSSLGTMVTIEQTDRSAGRNRLGRGGASALLIIPKGYDRAVIRDEPAQWTLITNPEQSFMPRVIHEAVSANLEAAFYLQRMAGPQLRSFQGGPPSAVSFGSVMTGIRSAATYLQPSRIAVKATPVGNISARRPSVSEILFPGLAMFVVLMMASGMSQEIWKERNAGAVGRVFRSPASIHGFLAGKVAAVLAVLLIATTLAFASARAVFHIPMRAVPLAIVWPVLGGAVIYCGLLLAQLWLGGERTASTVGGMIMVPLAMLGGNFFPFESMPESFARFGKMTPNGWMLVQLESILSRPLTIFELARDFAVLIAAGAVLFAITAWSARRRLLG